MNWFQELLGSFASATANQTFDSSAPAQVKDQLFQWFGYLSANALRKFSPNLIDPELCEACPQVSVGDCIVCGARCCLAHAHISHRADLVCDECVRALLGTKEKEKQVRAQERAHRKAQRQTSSPGADADLISALKLLGLKRGAPWSEIHTTYRRLSLEYHPDRAKTEKARLKSEAKLKELNAAYALLKAYYEKAV